MAIINISIAINIVGTIIIGAFTIAIVTIISTLITIIINMNFLLLCLVNTTIIAIFIGTMIGLNAVLIIC